MHLWTAYITIIVTCCWFNFFVKLAHCSYQGTKSPLCQSLHVSHYVRKHIFEHTHHLRLCIEFSPLPPPRLRLQYQPKVPLYQSNVFKGEACFHAIVQCRSTQQFFFFFLHQHNFHSTYQICLPVYFKTKNTIKLKRCCFYTVEDFHYAKQLPKQRCPEWSKNSRSAGSMAGGGYLGFFFG